MKIKPRSESAYELTAAACRITSIVFDWHREYSRVNAETRTEKKQLGVELLAHIESTSLELSSVIDRIETVTTDPQLTREILDQAERQGILDRDGAQIHVSRESTFVRFDQQVVTRDGEFECRRCGAGLSTGHFIQFDSGELGPFGSLCVRKVTGRE